MCLLFVCGRRFPPAARWVRIAEPVERKRVRACPHPSSGDPDDVCERLGGRSFCLPTGGSPASRFSSPADRSDCVAGGEAPQVVIDTPVRRISGECRGEFQLFSQKPKLGGCLAPAVHRPRTVCTDFSRKEFGPILSPLSRCRTSSSLTVRDRVRLATRCDDPRGRPQGGRGRAAYGWPWHEPRPESRKFLPARGMNFQS